ncbi:MAG: dihydropteroate synthase [Clostridiales bacterium]|nr:dihydropteroate synthase [Clostridiales bacterium]
MKLMELVKNGIFYLDGGTGSYLQARGLKSGEKPEMWNLTNPEEIIDLHLAYYKAGSMAVCTNTFGVNALKFDGKDGRANVSQVVTAALSCAKKARELAKAEQELFIALDIGPLGRLLAPMGDLPFENAVELFAETIRAGDKAGADFILIETMNDCYETKAAVLAAKENSSLPIFVSNVYDESENLLSGTPPEAMVAMLEGLGVDVIGLNCSVGPDKMLDILPRFTACASVPILVKPNAGLPRSENGQTVYDLGAEEFADTMKQIVLSGAAVVGGCCGTTPEYIKALVSKTADIAPLKNEKKELTVISSYTHALSFGKEPILIGERINPTGKKRFKQALKENDIGYILKEGLAQQEQGVHVLDVNVGLPEIDEAKMLVDSVSQLQGVCNLPLQIDTSNPQAMAAAMRIYNGKPMINSVNGSAESMDAIFPLAKKYGGLIVCLTLDEKGIPETAQGRLEIARRITNRAAEYGIAPKDLIFDPLALTISSDQKSAQVTLESIVLIKEELSALSSLGVSNISFGLPSRDYVTASFFTMALTAGLSAAIVNPFSVELQKAYKSYMALAGLDPSCSAYIDFAQRVTTSESLSTATASGETKDVAGGLKNAIIKGLTEEASRLSLEALSETDPLTLINEQIVPALDIVGRGFEEKTVFLPQLLMSAESAKAAFEQAKSKMPYSESQGEPVILATVKGDIHDIGKNIVKALLQNYGFNVIDLGRDVSPEAIVEAAEQNKAKLVGLSALMTTTVAAMDETIKLLKKRQPHVLTVVGGAVLTQDYADMIGADRYAHTAMDTVRYAEYVLRS